MAPSFSNRPNIGAVDGSVNANDKAILGTSADAFHVAKA
jgi:hypothetical protein